MNKRKVFLGGTWNDSTWRDRLIPNLQIDYFNPVVKDWTSECMEEEIKQRMICDVVLYVITPKMKGVYSIAEVVDDSNKRSDVIFCVLNDDDDELVFDDSQIRSLDSVGSLVERNGGKYFKDLESVKCYLNI